MKTATINYTKNSQTVSTNLSFEYDQDDKIGRALVDGKSFPDSYEWNSVTDEEEGITDLVSFVQDNLIGAEGVEDIEIINE